MATTKNGRHIRCPVCGSDAFEQRHWVSMIRGAQLSPKAGLQLFTLRDQVEWFVCEECRYVLPFLAH